MPTTTTGISPLHLTLGAGSASSTDHELIASVMRKARRTDWDAVIAKADRAVSLAGVLALIVSLLYFAPIIFNVLVR